MVLRYSSIHTAERSEKLTLMAARLDLNLWCEIFLAVCVCARAAGLRKMFISFFLSSMAGPGPYSAAVSVWPAATQQPPGSFFCNSLSCANAVYII